MLIEDNKKPGSSDYLEEMRRKFFSTPEGKLRWERKCLRAEARYMLDKILDSDYNKGPEDFIAQKILITHGLGREEMLAMTFDNVHKTAAKLIAQDLLINEFYTPEGNLTDFAKNYYPDVDPKDFVVITTAWPIIQKELEKQVGINPKGRDNMYAGHIYSQEELDEKSGDVVARYADVFGKENIIALPFTIHVHPFYVEIHHQSDFIPPHGGEFAQRLVFVSRFTSLRFPSLQ